MKSVRQTKDTFRDFLQSLKAQGSSMKMAVWIKALWGGGSFILRKIRWMIFAKPRKTIN
jgi:hypothetical protein